MPKRLLKTRRRRCTAGRSGNRSGPPPARQRRISSTQKKSLTEEKLCKDFLKEFGLSPDVLPALKAFRRMHSAENEPG